MVGRTGFLATPFNSPSREGVRGDVTTTIVSMKQWAQLFGEKTDCGDEPLPTPFNSPSREGVRWDVAIAIVQVMEWAQLFGENADCGDEPLPQPL
jgi:hypothetical protein